MFSITMVMQFLGGLGLFLYGVNVTSEGLQKIAAKKLKNILASLTRKPWAATLFGIVMTVALQSSTATTVMIVEFVNSGLMTLTQALGVVLGSAVGTSIVIQLISFPILDFALLLLFIGFIMFFLVRTMLAKSIGQALIGFGCIFVGMSLLSGAFSPLKSSPDVDAFLSQFGTNPILGIAISMVVTALLQSSAAFLAILISLSTHGLLSVESVIPLVMGAHIGGTLTTLFSSLSAERADAVRVAAANTLYRLAAAVILLPFFSYFTRFIEWSAADLPRQVANTHLFSAVLMVILFLPLNKILSKWLIKLIPQRRDEGKKPRLIYITKAAPELPAVALTQARQEIRWVANKILENMVQILPRIIFYGDTKILQELERTEREVDWHYQELSKFFTELFRRNMTREQIVESHSYQLIIKELEYIADSLIVMARLGARIHAAQIMVEETDQEKAGELYIAVSSNFLTLLRYLERGDQALALLIIKAHQDIIEIYNQVQNSLTCRISKDDQGMQELNSWLYKIGEHIVRIAKILQD